MNFAWTEPEAGAIASLKRGDCEFCDKLEDYPGVLSASQRRFESDPFTLDKPTALDGRLPDAGLIDHDVGYAASKGGPAVQSDGGPTFVVHQGVGVIP